MNEEVIGYFKWLCKIIDCDAYPVEDYTYVLWRLMETKFVVTMDMDNNRVEDAINLRTRYLPWSMDMPVSILEIMVSMSIRIEEHIMANTSDEDRTPVWFWSMMQNLGLRQQFNDVYDGDDYVDSILHDFNNRHYARNGLGGLFVTRDSTKDMRKLELWYQMHAQFNDILSDEGYLRKEY